jgi:hypothetical protein
LNSCRAVAFRVCTEITASTGKEEFASVKRQGRVCKRQTVRKSLQASTGKEEFASVNRQGRVCKRQPVREVDFAQGFTIKHTHASASNGILECQLISKPGVRTVSARLISTAILALTTWSALSRLEDSKARPSTNSVSSVMLPSVFFD